MDSPTKLATFLRSAANGELDEVPPGLSQALRFLFTIRSGLLDEVEAMPASDVDNALESTARLALSLRSDELDALTTVEAGVLEDLFEGRRLELERRARAGDHDASDIAELERMRGGIVLGVDVE